MSLVTGRPLSLFIAYFLCGGPERSGRAPCARRKRTLDGEDRRGRFTDQGKGARGLQGGLFPHTLPRVFQRGNQGPEAANDRVSVTEAPRGSANRPARRHSTQRLHNCVLSELAGLATSPSEERLVPDKTDYVRANVPHVRAGSLRRRRFAQSVRIALSGARRASHDA